MYFRILKMIVTSSFLTALECTKFVFGRTPLGELTALSQTPSWFKEALLLSGRRGERRGGKGERMTREVKGGERKEGEGPAPLWQIPGSAPD